MIGKIKFLSSIVCLLGIFSSSALAEIYAPLLDTTGVKNSYFRNHASLDVPDKAEVPVVAYPAASLLYVSNISSTGNSQFQENRIVYLTTKDSSSTVLDFYKKKLPDWNRRTVKNKEIFLKTGKQFFWSGSKRLDGPRVEVIDLTAGSQTLDIPINMLQKSFPEMKTVIKVYYEHSSSPLVAVDIKKLVASCVEKEIESKSKLFGGDPSSTEAQQFLRKNAENTCKKVETVCQKSTDERVCQKFARSY